MADQPKPDAAEQADATAGASGRVVRLLHWASASKLRMGLLGLTFIIGFGTTFASWSYLAHKVIEKNEEFTLAKALQALDRGEYIEAKNIIGKMEEEEDESTDLGGSLFVLGAVKSAQAELEWSESRRRAMHLIASRYLKKARELGIPSGYENLAQFLIGKSLVRGNQPQAGIDILRLLVDEESVPTLDVHILLAKAFQAIPEPDYATALEHNQIVLDTPNLAANRQAKASIRQAYILGQLGRLDEASKYLKLTGDTTTQQANIKNIAGQLALAKAERLPAGSPVRIALAEQSRADLREAQRLDPLNSKLIRQSMYWIGKSYELSGKPIEAIKQYDQLGKSYGDTAESMTAMLAKADLARQAGESEKALAGYRAVLSAVGDPVTYNNRLLPFSALRKKLSHAFNDFIQTEQFSVAMALADSLPPVFSLMEITKLRGQAHETWAGVELALAAKSFHSEAKKHLASGRYHHRAAGAAYELLSELRYSSEQFNDDLWLAAKNYFRGQSYSHTDRILTKYLHHEALQRQALALLRQGQSKLALGKNIDAIEILEECVEMYPHDAVIYQARLECAHAHLQQGEGKRAEELLLANLRGSNLGPAATEWLDSLFLLGDLQHNSGQFNEAIHNLDEAVSRYEEIKHTPRGQKFMGQALLARYTIARAYHSASEKSARLANDAKTEDERIKNRKERNDKLNNALTYYHQVQELLTLKSHAANNELERTLLRNCYMLRGSVLFQLKRYDQAKDAYGNISSIYQQEPFVLESYVHIANCYRQLDKPMNAKRTIEQAKLVLNQIPADTDFKISTNFSRQSWELLLNEMGEWQ